MPTVINEQLNKVNTATVVNELININVLPIGSKIGNYEVIDYISTDTGEANVYLCEHNSEKVVAKVYRREESVKKDVFEKLEKVNSPFVTKPIEKYKLEKSLVEILPYYKNGSLEEKTFSYEILKNRIIPSLNEGLKALHENNIVHKDLKPSNIMLTDDNRVSIIDFGISSVISDEVSMIITKTGITLDYAAPESYPPLYGSWYGVDYYSLGVVIYKLFYGRLPFQEIKDEESRKRYLLTKKIPFVGNIPEDLKELIEGLTYIDISNQDDKQNPNRRWTYEEVLNWCNGKKQPVPGSVNNVVINNFGPIVLNGISYTNKTQYILALLEDWEYGKSKLYRGGLSKMFADSNDDLCKICENAENRFAGQENEDVLFLKTMLKLEPSIDKIYWKGFAYENIVDLGNRFLNELQNGMGNMKTMINTMLENDFFSSYLLIKNEKDSNSIAALKAIETSYKVNKSNPIREYYMLAYSLAKDNAFRINSEKFSNISELEKYMLEQLKNSVETFENVCKSMIDDNGQLKIEFEAWLVVHGKKDAIDRWKNCLSK